MIGGCFGSSNPKATQFKFSVGRRKSTIKTSPLDMRRADFKLLRENPVKILLKVQESISVVLIFKQGKRDGPGNYRPISFIAVAVHHSAG